MLAEFAGSLPSGIWQKSAFWSDGEAVHREVTNWKRSATKPPKMGAGEATGHAAAVRHWRNCICLWSQALEKPPTLEEPGAGNAICVAEAHNREASTLRDLPSKPNSTALSFCDVSPAPSSDKPKILLDDKGKYLKGPDLFSQSRNERLV